MRLFRWENIYQDLLAPSQMDEKPFFQWCQKSHSFKANSIEFTRSNDSSKEMTSSSWRSCSSVYFYLSHRSCKYTCQNYMLCESLHPERNLFMLDLYNISFLLLELCNLLGSCSCLPSKYLAACFKHTFTLASSSAVTQCTRGHHYHMRKQVRRSSWP